MVLTALALLAGNVTTQTTPVQAKAKSMYYYFVAPGGPSGPAGDEFIVMRVRGSKVWVVTGAWASEGAIGRGKVTKNKVTINYVYPTCSGGTTTSKQVLKRKGSRSTISVKGFKRQMRTASLAKLDRKYIAIVKEMYPGDDVSSIGTDFFTSEFRDAARNKWINDSYC